jgi:hypothetical protein
MLRELTDGRPWETFRAKDAESKAAAIHRRSVAAAADPLRREAYH